MVDALLVHWVRRKYKGFKKRLTGAWNWLKRLKTRQPTLLPASGGLRPRLDNRSRVSREPHARFWESAEARFLRATRLWQYSSPGKGVVFDFEMTRSGEVPKKIFKDYSGILHTDGYAGYGEKVGAKGMIHACCLAHSRRKFIEAVKVNAKDLDSARVVVLMDALFAIDREALEQKLSINERDALRKERAPVILEELHALLLKMTDRVLPKSLAGKAVSYTLARWEKLTCFMQHPVIELNQLGRKFYAPHRDW